MIWILSLLACKTPVVDVIPGVDTSLQIVVTNPTSCALCDPFRDVDTLRLEVRVGDDVVASDSFAYPDEPVTLPDLSAFGVVRITLLGLVDGKVVSAGRTPEIVLVPDAAQSVPLVFLPANRALPLDAPMLADRSRHIALSRRDGTVLLIGGLDPRQERATATTELYDPAVGSFAEFDPLPAAGVAEPRVAALPDGASLLVGGFALIDGNTVPVEDTALFDDTASTFTAAGPLSQARAGHCIAMFRERQGIVFGGASGFADYLKPSETTGEWSFLALEMRDFDPGAVTACVAMPDGRVFVQGRDLASTGLWDAVDSTVDPGAAFTAMQAGTGGDLRYVEGPVLLPTDEGAWVLGGADVSTGEVYADGRHFLAGTMHLDTVAALARPRFDASATPWIESGWYVVGAGWADAGRAAGEPSVELIAPDTGKTGLLIDLDRPRPGCATSVLRDGSILVTGGYELGDTSVVDAAIIVPWMDSEEPG